MNDKYVAVPREDWEGILDSVRGKTGKTALLKSGEVKPEIDGIKTGGDLPEEAFVVTGDCQYRFAYGAWDWFINQFGNRVVTSNIYNFKYMFLSTTVKQIPFKLNGSGTRSHDMAFAFSNAQDLETLPEMSGVDPTGTQRMFDNCRKLKSLPEDLETYFTWKYMDGSTSQYINGGETFYQCYSLRFIPVGFLSHFPSNTNYGYSYFKYGFYGCKSLDELVDLPIPYRDSTWTNNAFSTTFGYCCRLKNITFEMPDGMPCVMNWKNQVIDLSAYCGWDQSNYDITVYAEIPLAKQVSNDTQYQALKDDPDWFTTNYAYSRYNHDSAVATINSLPDTSAYLATAGGTNTIKFKGVAGSLTDGGAINTLTAEEIAVATAKGWTVTLA